MGAPNKKRTGLQIYRFLEGIRGGYELNPKHGFLSVVVPESTENIVDNPSVEVLTTGWTAASAQALSTVWQTSGASSIRLTIPVGGTYAGYYTQTVVAATRYTWSVDLKVLAGRRYSLRVVTDPGGTVLATKPFTGTGFTQRESIGFTTDASTSVKLYISILSTPTEQYYIYADSMQVEAKSYATTYCDGEQQGCMWRGAAHSSASMRAEGERSGGRLKNLKDVGFSVLAITGMDIPPIKLSSAEYAVLPGSVYMGHRYTQRAMTIVGAISGVRPAIFQKHKKQVIELFNPTSAYGSTVVYFQYQAFDDCRQIGEAVKFAAVYAEGLEGMGDNMYQERVAVRFILFLPFVFSLATMGYTIDWHDTFCQAPLVVGRINGVWDSLGCSPFAGDGNIEVAKFGPDGKLYIGGSFQSLDNVAGFDYIARYNFVTSAWEVVGAVGDGTGTVYDMAWDSQGNLYLVGDFEDWGTVLAADAIVKWDGVNWTAVGTPKTLMNPMTIRTILIDNVGDIWVGGSFSELAGLPTANGIAKRDVSASSWVAVGDMTSNYIVFSIVQDASGNIFAAGDVDTALGGPFIGVGKYVSGTTWEQVGTITTGNEIYSLNISVDGTMYAGGLMSSMGGYTVGSIAAYRGFDWERVGSASEQLPTGTVVQRVATDHMGNLYSTFDTDTTGLHFSFPAAMWNGYSWVGLDIASLDTSNNIANGHVAIAIAFDGAGGVFIGTYAGYMETAGDTVESAGLTIVNNPGSADAHPTFVITGPGTLYTIFNETTGERLWFDLDIAAGETVYLSLGPNPTFTSDYKTSGLAWKWQASGGIIQKVPVSYERVGLGRGDIMSTILPGSDVSSFHLAHGDNRITVLLTNHYDANTAVKMYFHPTYLGVTGASGVLR